MTKSEYQIGSLFVAWTACCVCAANLCQISYKLAVVVCLLVWAYLAYQYQIKSNFRALSPRQEKLVLALVLMIGTLVRGMVSIEGYGNYDSVSWEQVAEILEKGQNVYDHTTRYNTSPVWFWALGLIKKLSLVCTMISFRSWVRIFLSGVDLVTAALLWRGARHLKVSPVMAVSLFYLNPVSILLSSYHAQFEDLAVLFLVLGIIMHESRPESSRHKFWAWFCVTLGMIVKHNICYQLPITLRYMYGGLKHWVGWFFLSCLLFFVFFLPYWRESHAAIVKNVWLYGSYPMAYGISTFWQAHFLKYFFLLAIFGYAFVQRSKDMVLRCLQGMLFFLSFTPGFGHQYLVLPIALGALRPSKNFLIYSLVASCVIMGSDRNIYIKALSWIPLNAVWFCAVLWFVSVHAKAAQSTGSLGAAVHPSEKDPCC